MSDFDTALQIANNAHEGQVDKGGLPYILHPLHVASFFTGDRKIIAILHDVVEDSAVTMVDLEGYGFSDRVCRGVFNLTRQHGETYDEYIQGVAKNPDSVAIKLRDLEHNMDITRLSAIDEGCWARLMRYHSAYRFLEQQ